jgi:hypothetical protein
MTFDGTCERGGFQRAPQEIEKVPPASAECSVQCRVQWPIPPPLAPLIAQLVEGGGRGGFFLHMSWQILFSSN